MAIEVIVVAVIGWFMSPVIAKGLQSVMTSSKDVNEESKLPSLGNDRTMRNQHSISPDTLINPQKLIRRLSSPSSSGSMQTTQNQHGILANTLINSKKLIRQLSHMSSSESTIRTTQN